MAPTRIVILGSGFGGVYTYRSLTKKLRRQKNVEITIVSQDNYFLFSPMLHEVATGGLNRHDIVQPIRQIVRRGYNGRFLMATVTGVNTAKRTVTTTGGTLAYDYLVLALGSETRFGIVKGAKKFAVGLKTVHDAVCIRNSVLKLLEAATASTDQEEQRRLLRWIVVGGGPTGIELAPELVEFARAYAKSSPHCPIDKLEVHIFHGDPTLLPQFEMRVGSFVATALRQKGVTVHLNARIESDSAKGVHTSNEGNFLAGIVIWAAGVVPVSIPITPMPHYDQRGRLQVSPTLLTVGTDNVFAVGDMASVDAPQTAQAAVGAAKIVASNIVALMTKRPLGNYKYRENGLLVSLGQLNAAGTVYGVFIHGVFAWWLWRTIYLSKLIGTSNKLRVAIDWTLNLFYARDTSEI